jgi:hypothetical protein
MIILWLLICLLSLCACEDLERKVCFGLFFDDHFSFRGMASQSSPVGKLSTRHRKPSGMFSPSSVGLEGDNVSDSLLVHFKTTLRELGLDTQDVEALSAFCFGRRISSVRPLFGMLPLAIVFPAGLCGRRGTIEVFHTVVQTRGHLSVSCDFVAFPRTGGLQGAVPRFVKAIRRENGISLG